MLLGTSVAVTFWSLARILELGRPSNLGGHMSTGFRVPIRQPIRGNYGLHMAIKPVFRPAKAMGWGVDGRGRAGRFGESLFVRLPFPAPSPRATLHKAELVLAPRSWQALGWDSLLVDNGSRSRLPPAAPEHLFPVYSPFLFAPFLFAPFLFAPHRKICILTLCGADQTGSAWFWRGSPNGCM